MESRNEKSPISKVLKNPASLRMAIISLMERETLALEKGRSQPGAKLAMLIQRRVELQSLLIMVNRGSEVPVEAYERFERLISDDAHVSSQ